MDTIHISRNSLFPLRSLQINIGEQNIKLKGKTSATIQIPDNVTQLQMKMDWWSKTVAVTPAKNLKIAITHILPDWFYILGLIGIIALSVATYLSAIAPIFLGVYAIVYVIIVAVPLLIKSYFKIKTEAA